MPTALLAWELGAGVGHCVNLAPIARELVAREWNVWVVARDVTVAERVLRPAAVRYLSAPVLLAKPTQPVSPTRNFAHILHNVGFGSDHQLGVLLAAWWNLMEMIQPDVLVCEHAPAALVASRRYDVRRVVLGTGFFSPPDERPLPEIRYWAPPPADGNSEQIEQGVLDRINRLVEHTGAAPFDRLSQVYAEVDANFLLTFSELDHYPNRRGADYWGMWSLPSENLPAWPEGDGPRLFAYLKQLPSTIHMSALLSSVREIGPPALVYIPEGDPAWLARFKSPQLRLTTTPVDIREVARTCKAAILNGNAGTATELLLAGIPQLHLPLYLEQEVFSRRVVDLGAGLVASANRPEQFAVRLSKLLNESDRFREAAGRFAAKYLEFETERVLAQIVSRIVQ